MEETKLINGFPHILFSREIYSEEDMGKRSKAFFEFMDERRTVRDISNQHIPREVIEHLVMTASTAPSGAHKQPWTFCLVSNKKIKKKIRQAAEEEEYRSYHGRMSQEWLDDLKAIGTDWNKPFLEKAPWLIIVFKKVYDLDDEKKHTNYYVNESVGLACGFLLAAIHQAGLVALTHTPSPMNFLSEVLDRPDNERPFLLIPLGYPEKEAYVPDLKRKSPDLVSVYFE